MSAIHEFLRTHYRTSQFILANLTSEMECQEALANGTLLITGTPSLPVALAYVSRSRRIHLQGQFDPHVMSQVLLRCGRPVGVNGPQGLIDSFLN